MRIDPFGLSAAFAILVVFPTALGIDKGVPRWLAHLGRWAALPAAFSLLLPRGPVAAVLATIWVAVSVLHAVHGLVRFVSSRLHRSPVAWAEAASAAGPVVASVALVWSRWNGTFAGFGEPLATLTVTHFHFTFGLLPLALAALVRMRRVSSLALWGVVFAPPLVGALFALRSVPLVPSLAEAGAIVLLATAVVLAAGTLRPVPGSEIEGLAVRIASLLLAGCTTLAAWFSVHLALGLPTLTYFDMLRWHGVGNALATFVIGLHALRRARFDGVAIPEPAPDRSAPTRDVEEARAFFRDDRTFDLGLDRPGRFDRVADALLRYRFYPPDVMRHRTTFPDRPAKVGDRIGMVLLVALFPGYAPIALPSTTEVDVAERDAEHVSFGYRTTTAHYGKGAWRATVTRGERLTLRIQSRMTPTHPFAVLGLPIYRWFQRRAHRLGAENLARTP